MVPSLHQSKVYMQKNLQVWKVQKCIPLVSSKIARTCVGQQTTPSHVSQYKAENGNLRKSRSTIHHGTVFAPKQSLHQRKLHVWRVPKYIPLVGAKTALTSAGWQATPSHVRQYRAENRILRKSESTFHHGTIFAPKQCLYQKKATCMESSKMHYSSRCKNHTYLCGMAN